ncbi:ABC transporter substrate-binding protein [Brenneria tiliae]|uniref:ABC transporter substrate-binding protein n=2 Tax=Brenneria tiliae TaxID=2914984 RepID=UPI002014EB5D|nr:ABC transporter substrate-binding protein [Brenneria tiliae]MCL2903643.1 ABC transporter substrate-binding protein [Brenneria tiliae]
MTGIDIIGDIMKLITVKNAFIDKIATKITSHRIICGLLTTFFSLSSFAETPADVLKIIPSSNLVSLDPIWTTANVTRNHGYMIYDTLFGTDIDGNIKPQMVESWKVSDDNLTWTFVLRDGLKFSDGTPVTSDDVIPSLQRWSTRDSFGSVLASFVERYQAVDAKTFTLTLKEPFGMMLEALGKPSSNVPFIMPKAVAQTSGDVQIRSTLGSGPYMFKSDEFKSGERVVYVKNPYYVPRDEPPSGTTGGKKVYIDRVEWLIIRDPQTQFNALINGEADILEQPAFEQIPALGKTPNINLVKAQPIGMLQIIRFNFLQPPFNDARIRRAAMLALGEQQMLRVQIGVPELQKFCKSMYPCGTTFASDETGEFTGVANPQKAKALLQEAGYQGQPVVLMRPTDSPTIAKLPLVAKQQLEQAGFKVDLQNMDWQTLVARRAKKDAPSAGGWNAFMTAWAAEDVLNPLTMAMMNARGEKGWFGWQDDPELEALKARFARTMDEGEKKKLATQIQLRAFETVTHVPLGQYELRAAVRSNVTGLVSSGAQVYWNIRKQ